MIARCHLHDYAANVIRSDQLLPFGLQEVAKAFHTNFENIFYSEHLAVMVTVNPHRPKGENLRVVRKQSGSWCRTCRCRSKSQPRDRSACSCPCSRCYKGFLEEI